MSCKDDGPFSEDDFYSVYFPNDRIDPNNYIYYIYTACTSHHMGIVSELLTHPQFVDRGDLNLLFLILCKEGLNNCLKLLLQDSRVNPSYKHNEGIILAITENHTSLLRTLLEDPRTDPTDQNYEAFRLLEVRNTLCHRSMKHILLDDYRVINALGVGMDKNKMLDIINEKTSI